MLRKAAITVAFLLGILMLIAVADNPYGYYQFLRIAAAFLALFIAYAVNKSHEGSKAVWFFVAVAILFNPFIPIYLDKGLWMVIDVVVALSIPLVTVMSLNSDKRTTKH